MNVQGATQSDSYAQRLIDRYNLRNVVSEANRIIFAQSASPLRVLGISQSVDTEWDQDKPRVLLTVQFDADLLGAYEAWKLVQPLVEPVTGAAEDGETLSFDFTGRVV